MVAKAIERLLWDEKRILHNDNIAKALGSNTCTYCWASGIETLNRKSNKADVERRLDYSGRLNTTNNKGVDENNPYLRNTPRDDSVLKRHLDPVPKEKHLVAMSLDVAGNVQGARQLREHGQYADAIKHLERILGESVWDLDLAVELGETLLIQGYFGRATKILEDNLRHHVLPNNLTAIAGEIICCFARFFETSQFKESLRHVESLYHDFSSGGDSKVLNDATVRISLCHYVQDFDSKGPDRNILLQVLEACWGMRRYR